MYNLSILINYALKYHCTIQNKKLAIKLAIESALVSKESMKVLSEFEQFQEQKTDNR